MYDKEQWLTEPFTNMVYLTLSQLTDVLRLKYSKEEKSSIPLKKEKDVKHFDMRKSETYSLFFFLIIIQYNNI